MSMSTCQSLAIAFENLNGFCRRSRTGGASLESGVCVGNGTASIIMLGVLANVTRRNALEDEANIAFVWHAVDSTTLQNPPFLTGTFRAIIFIQACKGPLTK